MTFLWEIKHQGTIIKFHDGHNNIMGEYECIWSKMTAVFLIKGLNAFLWKQSDIIFLSYLNRNLYEILSLWFSSYLSGKISFAFLKKLLILTMGNMWFRNSYCFQVAINDYIMGQGLYWSDMGKACWLSASQKD